MHEYHQSKKVQAPVDQVFDFVAEIKNLPQYLPTVHKASPQAGERIQVEGEVGGHRYKSDGYFRVDRKNRRLEWGSDGENNYSGSLDVKEAGDAASEVAVNIQFDPKPELAKKFDEQGEDRHQVINDGINKALVSIKNICEGKGGKVETARRQSGD
ncbi:MAG: SRPBCC family protein [Acidobacteriota bacterium]